MQTPISIPNDHQWFPLTKTRWQLGNRLLIESTDANLRFGILTVALAFQASWRRSLARPRSAKLHLTRNQKADKMPLNS